MKPVDLSNMLTICLRMKAEARRAFDADVPNAIVKDAERLCEALEKHVDDAVKAAWTALASEEVLRGRVAALGGPYSALQAMMSSDVNDAWALLEAEAAAGRMELKDKV